MSSAPSDTITKDQAQQVARSLIDTYFRTTPYPYTRHHIDSYDQFLQSDLVSIVQSQNPVLLLKELLDPADNTYRYRVEIFIGGETGTEIEIGTPTVSLQNTEEVRLLLPNEARLRNLTYASTVYANILVKITYTTMDGGVKTSRDISPAANTFQKFPLFKIPIMLHSRYCILHGKPKEFLREAGECPYDNGGYFIVDGAEKVLITRQEQAFNTLYITPQKDPLVKIYSSITCLSPQTRTTKRVNIAYMRRDDTIQISLPYVRKAIPLFVLFRALGFQSDEAILRLMYPDFEAPEAKLMLPKLQACIVDAFPFTTTYMAIQYIKTLTKGFSEAHVLDIIRNQLFTHQPNDATSQALFLADCVRRILRVNEGFDGPTDRDDTRNQRCLTSGFLTQLLFNNAYKLWRKAFVLATEREYEANKKVLYKDENFTNIFQPGNAAKIFEQGLLTEQIMRGFRGRWDSGLGEEKSGVLQALSRLSYCDFMSHCRRVVLDFDTGMKLTGPRKLHTSQYGYFCTSETPSGASIGITKNMCIMAAISTAGDVAGLQTWLRNKGRVYLAQDLTDDQRAAFVPAYVNNGFFGMTAKPQLLTEVLRLFKRTGCLPYSSSITFSIRERRVQIFLDEGRPLRPLVALDTGAVIPVARLRRLRTWRDLVLGSHPSRTEAQLSSTAFVDPLPSSTPLEAYVEALLPHIGVIEYIDPYEQNEAFIANYPEYIRPETTHIEVHPSTIMSLMTTLIPFPNHNQSPRNQLSCSQSKQGLSIYATNWQNRFDNTAHILCYGEAPLSRTIYSNYLAEGRIPYGLNIVLAIACWSGYNQEDGIVMNYDAVQRGMFRSVAYRSYETFEEDDEMAKVKVRFGNPAKIASWKDLKPGLDYSKLDERGFIREGEYCDENTVLVGAYMTTETGQISDSSLTPQVWTRGRVEKIAITVNNAGLRLIKIRVVQDRIPELGDKFSNRHGQKGTIGALLRGHDMPRTADGIVPDMIMNPHAIPSRMTIAQNLEQLLGKTAAATGAVGDATAFMNDGSPEDQIGAILAANGYEKYGNELLYNGQTGEQIPAAIFIGPVYGMRLKHMVEDKWQARGKGRKEQRTHQPTGGRGQQGGLKIGEMDRDAIIGHSMTGFFRESFMERSDGATIPLCTSCGTIPIYNPRLGISVCPLCEGPVKFVGDRPSNFELLPPLGKPKGRTVEVEMPYATKVLTQELETYMNIGLRYITSANTQMLQPYHLSAKTDEIVRELPNRILPTLAVPEVIEPVDVQTVTVEQLREMGADVGALQRALNEVDAARPPVLREYEPEISEENQAMEDAAAAAAAAPVVEFPETNEDLGPVEEVDFSDLPPLLPANEGLAQPLPLPQPLPPAVPNGPPTIAVDTSPEAMNADGLNTLPRRSRTEVESETTRKLLNTVPAKAAAQNIELPAAAAGQSVIVRKLGADTAPNNEID